MKDEIMKEFLLQEDAKPYGLRHRSFYFSKAVVFFIKGCKYDRIYISMFDQLLRSATSIGANIVEGKSGSSQKDWINFLAIALKSANETKYWLCLIRDTISVNRETVQELLKEADELSKIIAAIIIKVKTN